MNVEEAKYIVPNRQLRGLGYGDFTRLIGNSQTVWACP